MRVLGVTLGRVWKLPLSPLRGPRVLDQQDRICASSLPSEVASPATLTKNLHWKINTVNIQETPSQSLVKMSLGGTNGLQMSRSSIGVTRGGEGEACSLSACSSNLVHLCP